MMMQMLGSFAEFERAMVRERTQAGLRSARAQGRRGGRQPKLTRQQQAEVIAMLAVGRSAADVARLFNVHRATISRIVSNAADRKRVGEGKSVSGGVDSGGRRTIKKKKHTNNLQRKLILK